MGLLREVGHTIIPFEVPEIQEAMEIYLGLMSADSFECVKKLVENEVVDPIVNNTLLLTGIPNSIRNVIAFVLKNILNWKRLASAFIAGRKKTVNDEWELLKRRNEYRRKFHEYWSELQIDCIICPVTVLPALPHDTEQNTTSIIWSYTMLYNLLDYPAGVVPISIINKSNDIDHRECLDFVDKELKKCSRKISGVPLSVQIVTKPFEEELNLRVMREIETLINFTHQPDFTSITKPSNYNNMGAENFIIN